MHQQLRAPTWLAGPLSRAGITRTPEVSQPPNRLAGAAPGAAYIWVMSFDVTADSYDRFMGRFSEPLAVQFAGLAGVRAGQRVLDVGCGPGALTAQLVERAGAGAVCAIDPSASFVAAVRARFPEVDVRSGAAEQLPFLTAASTARSPSWSCIS